MSPIIRARYGRIIDADVKMAVAKAWVETLVADQQCVGFDNGRVPCRPMLEHKNALEIAAINDPNPAR